MSDRKAREYDKWYDENKYAYLTELEALKQHLPKHGKGLEIGVGTGRFASQLGISVGIDPSEKMLEIAKERGVDAIRGMGENLPFEDNGFDFCLIVFTLFIVQDPEKVLQESYRVIKQGGKIILGIVDKDSFLGKFYQSKKGTFLCRPKFLSVNEVTNLIEKTGFKELSISQTLFHLPHEIKSIENPEQGSGKGGFVIISAVK